MPFEWDGKFSIGIKTFDNQHRNLFNLINNLEKSVREGDSRAMVALVLDELLRYTVTHFSEEERVLREKGYPDYEHHLKEHNELIEQVREFKESHDAGKSVVTMELMGFLVNWLTNHINQTDRKYTSFLKSNGVE